MNAQQPDRPKTQNAKNETTGKVFLFTGLALLIINGAIALILSEPKVALTILPMSVIFIAVGAGLWEQARKARRQE